jgi:hypothetical protein
MSTPIETNTEELQEILQTVNNLPGMGGKNYDLVIVLNVPSEKYLLSTVTADDISVIGDYATVKAKILNDENVNVILKHEYDDGYYKFKGKAAPFKIAHLAAGESESISADFVLSPYPGSRAFMMLVAHCAMTSSGEVFFKLEQWAVEGTTG